MAIDVQRSLDFGNARKILNLPDPINPQDPTTKSYVDSVIEGLAWKDSSRVSTQGNLNLSSPGTTIDGIVMVSNDRVLVRLQTAASENGIYIWNGAAVAMTRAQDMNVAAEVEQAVTTVEEGTSANTSYRQSAVNVTLGTTSLSWSVFGSSSGAASTSSAGIVQLATQAETDVGTDTLKAVSPSTLASSVWSKKQFVSNFGDGSATSYVLTHNLNSRDVSIEVYRNSGNFDTILLEIQRTSVNSITIVTDTAPAANAFRAIIRA